MYDFSAYQQICMKVGGTLSYDIVYDKNLWFAFPFNTDNNVPYQGWVGASQVYYTQNNRRFK